MARRPRVDGAFADDHALVVSAFLTLYEATGDGCWFRQAREVADDLLRLFHDERGGGFFHGDRHRPADQRPKTSRTTPFPPNRLRPRRSSPRHVHGEAAYESAATGALALIADVAAQAPTAFGHALCAMDLAVGPRKEVAIIGDPTDHLTAALTDVVVRPFRPRVVLARGGDSTPERADDDVPLLRGRGTVGGVPAAYVCERFLCLAPVWILTSFNITVVGAELNRSPRPRIVVTLDARLSTGTQGAPRRPATPGCSSRPCQ